MGYGGMIHQFKNYVLRFDEARLTKVLKLSKQSVALIQKYETLGINDVERKALQKIKGVILAYENGAKQVQTIIKDGAKTAEEVDKVVKVSDKPALNGLNALSHEIIKSVEARALNLADNLQAMKSLQQSTMVVAPIIIIILVLLTIVIFSNKIVSPITRITKNTTDLSKGDTDITIEGTDRQDEIGEMALALEIFRENIIKRAEMEAEQEMIEQNAQDERKHFSDG